MRTARPTSVRPDPRPDAPTTRRRRVRARVTRRGRDDAGSTSLELVVLFPAVLLLIFGIIQGALYYHARNVALAAAQQGLRAEQDSGGSTSSGVTGTRAFLDQAGGDKVITSVTVTPARDATHAAITVTGTSVSVIPGIPGFTVTQTAAGTIERYTTPSDRTTSSATSSGRS